MVKKSILSNNNKNVSGIVIYIVLGIILLGLIGVLVYYLFFYDTDEDEPTPSPSSPSPSS